MKLTLIGTWEEHGPQGNHDHGYYLEAVELPHGISNRYAKVSYAFIPDELFPMLDKGEAVDLPDELVELHERI